MDPWQHNTTAEAFEPVLVEPFTLTGGGLTLWQMVYFKGRLKAKSANLSA